MQRFKFHTRTKRLGESVTGFVAELRPLAKYSNYASLKDLLRDRIVYCINDKCIHTKTSLSETAAKLTLYKRLEIATSIGHTLRKYSHRVAAIVSQQGVSCYKCGSKDHLADKCKFKGLKCFLCGK